LNFFYSFSFHDVCADTTPPIFYLNDTSRRVISLVEQYNKYRKAAKVLKQTNMNYKQK